MQLKALCLPLLLDVATATYIVRLLNLHLFANHLLTLPSQVDGLRSNAIRPELRRYMAPRQHRPI